MSALVSDLRRHGKRAISVVRLKPFDTASPDGRARERLRRAALTSLAAIAAKAVAMGSVIISVPLTLRYLGPERYGLWMTISSLLMLLSFADLGMGIGLQNVIAQAHGTEDRALAERSVSSGFFMLLGIGLGVLLCLGISYEFIPWARAFNLKSPTAVTEAGPAAAVFIACFAAGMPVGVVQRVQLGCQQGFQSSLWQCVGSILGVAALVLALKAKADLPCLVMALAGAPVLSSILNGVVFFGLQRPDLRPTWSRVDRDTVRGLFRIGAGFLVLQVSFALAYATDNFIIAHILGPASVATYSVCVRLFNIATMVVTMVSGSLWPAYSEAYARGDHAWLEKTFCSSVRTAIAVISIISLLLFWMGPGLVHAWAGPRCVPGPVVLAGMCVWVVLDTVRITVTAFLNAVNVIRFQTCLFLVYSIGSVLLKSVLGRSCGLAGIVWGGITAYGILMLVPLLWFVRRWFRYHGRPVNPDHRGRVWWSR